MFSLFRRAKVEWYFIAYGKGAHSKVIGDDKDSNPYIYGTPEYDAWNDGWELRK